MTGKIAMVDLMRVRLLGANDFVAKISDMSNFAQGVQKIFTL